MAISELETSVFMQAPVPICLLEGRDHRFVFANPAYLALVGGRDVVGQRLLDALPDLQGQGFERLLDRVMDSGEPYYGAEALVNLTHQADGQRYMTFVYAPKRDRDGKIDGVMVAATDVTEQVRARSELADERGKLETMFRVSPVAKALWRGPDLIFEKTNPVYDAIYANRKLVGRPVAEALPELADQPFLQMLKSVYATGQPVSGKEARAWVGPDEGGPLIERFYDFTYTRINHADGTPYGVYCHSADVTDRVRAREVETQLRREAEKANRTKDEFLAMLGHELRNPLAPIETALELLRMRRDKSLGRELDIIERQVSHLTRLVDDLLDVSRITSGKVELRREDLALDEVLGNALEQVSPLLEERRIEIELTQPEAALFVRADRTRLGQIFGNLLTNAAKFSDSGSKISVSVEAVDEAVLVRVTDRGIGIGAEMLPRVFELFGQESQGSDRARGGLGLGLAIVRTLVELHGGRVEAASAGPGLGSTFSVWLPTMQPPESTRTVQVPTASSVSPRRVLVVDDNADAADLLVLVLESRGHAVRVAYDGPSALETAKQFSPEVGVLDIGLPVMDGHEVAEALRARFPDIRLVAVTGYGQVADKRRTSDAGFDLHLVKPMKLERLTAFIEG